jgi:hypothetical protein
VSPAVVCLALAVLLAAWAYGAACGLGAAVLAALWVWGWE